MSNAGSSGAAAAAAFGGSAPSHLHIRDNETRINLSVSVPFARLTYDDSGCNVTYCILCHDNTNAIKWRVERRYNNFKVLHMHVGRHVPESADIFPSAGSFFRARTNTSRASIEKRRADLDRYMNAMVTSLLSATNAKQQRLCQPLIVKLLQFLEYPEWEDDDANNHYNTMGQQGGDNATIAQFWRSEGDSDAKSEVSTVAGGVAAFFAVSSFVEEAFNAQAPDIDIASSSSRGSGLERSGSALSNGSLGGSGSGSSAASSASRASSNAEDAGAMSVTALSTVTTYWAAPEQIKGSKLAIEIPDVACAPTVDGEFAVTVKHNVRAPRGDVRRKYDEMLYVIANGVFNTDTVPTPTLMREIILQFRRQHPKRQYSRGSPTTPGPAASSALRREAVEELNLGHHHHQHQHSDPSAVMSSDGLVMADTMDGLDIHTRSGAVPIPIRGLIDDQAGAPLFSSPPARGALADGRVSQLPSTFGGGGAPKIYRTVPRVSNSSHFVIESSGKTVPYRECKCSETAFCASGVKDHLQTPCGFTIVVEPTTQANFGTGAAQ